MTDGNLVYTNIQHNPRKKHGLSLNEYVLCDMIYHLSNNPKYNWCIMSKDTMANELGLSKRSITNLLKKLIMDGWLIKDENTKFLKSSQSWYNEFCLDREKSSLDEQKLPNDREKSSLDEQKLPNDREKSSPQVGKKVPSDREKSSHNNNRDTNTYNYTYNTNDKTKSNDLVIIPKYNNSDLELSNYFYDNKKTEPITLTLLKKKGTIENGAEEIRKLREIDLLNYEQIKAIIDFTVNNEFWSKQVFTLSKFRKKDKNLVPYFTVFIQQLKNDYQKQKETNKSYTSEF